jgi:AAA15 family ATPase/GTPase
MILDIAVYKLLLKLMKNIKNISIKNFRGIGPNGIVVPLSNYSLVIGDNGTSKTTILEALNYCLMQNFTSGRLSINDFYHGGNEPIEIVVEFDGVFDVIIPDGFTKHAIKCNKAVLSAHKRERGVGGRAFNELVVASHYYLPVDPRGEKGWTITRKSGTKFDVTEIQLSINYASADLPRAFYFAKSRDRQLTKGYNSSLSNVIDELNWRFEKTQRSKVDTDKFKHKNKELHAHIFENTDGDSIKKTIEELNIKLKEIDIEPVDFNILKTLTPYDSTEIVKNLEGFELPISQEGSGIEMIISLLFLETLARISKEDVVIIIDEPELHLHPTLQDKLATHLNQISDTIQIVVSTHSPFFFKNTIDKLGVTVLMAVIDNDKIKVNDAKDLGFGLLKWSPSWGEICYFAYNLATIEFHDDLYSALQDREGKDQLRDFEQWLISKGQRKEISWIDASSVTHNETLMTCIRNRIHHSDNTNRPMYSQEQLNDSIQRMIILLK